MYFTTLLKVALASAAITATPLKTRELTVNDTLVFINGTLQVVNKAVYQAENAALIAASAAVTPVIPTNSTSTNATTHSTLNKRCKWHDVGYPNPNQDFLQWDVPMSAVVKAGEADASIAVTAGYELSNSLEISAGIGSSWFDEAFSVTLGAAWSTTWTSSYTAAYTFTIPAGMYGVVVSNPKTVRYSGFVASGCIGEAIGTKTTYMADTYTSKAYGGLSWVDGPISLCTSKEYPIKNCIGDGLIA